jgi:hypothetical protein
VGDLKPNIEDELKMHDVTTIEIARCKAKATEKKFERSSLQKFDKMYSRQKDTDCRFCGDKWSPGHKCSNQKSNKHEDERKSDTSISKFDDDKYVSMVFGSECLCIYVWARMPV